MTKEMMFSKEKKRKLAISVDQSILWSLMKLLHHVCFCLLLLPVTIPTASAASLTAETSFSPSLISSSSSSVPTSNELSICRSPSQCTLSRELDLSKQSASELDKILREPMRGIYTELDKFAHQFEEILKDLMANSSNGFHNMFTRTYGAIFQKHSSMFTEMFNVLEKYFTDGTYNLESEFNRFFTLLYKKMFQELNAQYSFDNEYLRCINDHMETLKPFGDIPKKLIIEVKRSFIATRTFHVSLVTAKDIIKSVMEVPPTSTCYNYVTQMRYCQLCKGLADEPPCQNYCETVLTSCTRNYGNLNKQWNNYIDQLLLMISRLETSFNIESVVGPMDIKISEAIMNFQENGALISEKLFKICGKPRIGKRRAPRSPTRSHFDYGSGGLGPSSKGGESPLSQLLKEIKRKIKRNKDFWFKLPTAICSSSIATVNQTAEPTKSCWSQSKAEVFRIRDKSDANSKQSATLYQHIVRFKEVNAKLDAAYKGLDLTEANERFSDYISGSGSGSGDGDYTDNDDDDDEDQGLHSLSSSSPSYPSSTTDVYSSSINSNSIESKDDQQHGVNSQSTSTRSPSVSVTVEVTDINSNDLSSPAVQSSPGASKGSGHINRVSLPMLSVVTFLAIFLSTGRLTKL